MKSLRNTYLKKTPHPNNNQKKALKLFAPDVNFSVCSLGILSMLNECTRQVRKIKTKLGFHYLAIGTDFTTLKFSV